MKIMKGKKAFLWKTVAALVILALCAGPMLASSPTYANDKDSSADSKTSSAGSKATAGTVHNSFTVTISPATATAGVPTAFTLTFTNVSTTGYQQGVFQTHVPDGFTDVGTPSVVAPSPLNWFVNLVDSIITAWADKGKDKLNSGQSLLVSFTATPPTQNPEGSPAATLDLTPEGPNTTTAGVPFNVAVNISAPPGSTGSVSFSSTDGSPYPASLPGGYPYTVGATGTYISTGQVTLYNGPSQDITASGPITSPATFEFTTYAWSGFGPPPPNGNPDDLVGPQPTVTVAGLTWGTTLTDTETWTVNAGAPDSLVVTPDPETVTAGNSVPYSANAYDTFDNLVGDVTGSTAFAIQLGALGSWLANIYTSQRAGTWTVTGTYDSLSDTAVLNVNAITPPPPPPLEAGLLAPVEAGLLAPELVITLDVMGTLAEYPVSPEGRLLVDARTTSPNGEVTVEIPANTLVLNPDNTPTYLNDDYDIIVRAAGTPPPPPGYQMVAAYQFQPSGTTFSPEATVIIEYNAEKMPAGGVPVIAYYDEAAGQWTNLETAGYVAGGVEVPNTVQAHTAHLTYFAILAAQ